MFLLQSSSLQEKASPFNLVLEPRNEGIISDCSLPYSHILPSSKHSESVSFLSVSVATMLLQATVAYHAIVSRPVSLRPYLFPYNKPPLSGSKGGTLKCKSGPMSPLLTKVQGQQEGIRQPPKQTSACFSDRTSFHDLVLMGYTLVSRGKSHSVHQRTRDVNKDYGCETS